MAMNLSQEAVTETKGIECCICATQISSADSIVEHRPTGEQWKQEGWYYCVNCWIRMKRLRQKQINPEVLLRVLEL